MQDSVSELLTKINAIEDEQERIASLKANGNGRLQELLQLALGPAEFDLPAGAPPYKPEAGIYSHGLFWQEIRRLPNLLKGGKLSHLPIKREFMFIEMLENIHPADAKLLIDIKDKVWSYSNITRKVVNAAFPNLLGEEN